jgi:hypothetical protein
MKNHEKLSLNSRQPSQDSNQETPKYDLRALLPIWCHDNQFGVLQLRTKENNYNNYDNHEHNHLAVWGGPLLDTFWPHLCMFSLHIFSSVP